MVETFTLSCTDNFSIYFNMYLGTLKNSILDTHLPKNANPCRLPRFKPQICVQFFGVLKYQKIMFLSQKYKISISTLHYLIVQKIGGCKVSLKCTPII